MMRDRLLMVLWFIGTVMPVGVLAWSDSVPRGAAPAWQIEVAAQPPWVAPTLEELATGTFLIAGRNLIDPYFARSVVLLLEYGPKGALGLVINRPTDIALASLLPQLGDLALRGDRIYFGGPVSQNTLLLVVRSPNQPPESTEVFGGVYLSSSIDGLRAVLTDRTPESTFHAFAGYAGWGAGQLDNEISRGDWLISPGDATSVFDVESERLWEDLYRRHSGQWVQAPPSSPPDGSRISQTFPVP